MDAEEETKRKLHVKIKRSSRIQADAKKPRGGLRRISCSLFLVTTAVALSAVTLVKADGVGAFASPRANQGSMRLINVLPGNIILVTNTNDSGPGSLRNALALAKDADTIDATGVSGTILLTSSELQIAHNVTINGPGAENLALDGNTTSRVFENFASNVTISGFTITNGFAAEANGGGGILNHGVLTLSDSIVSNSAAVKGDGGGIGNDGGTLTVTNSAINGNSAFGQIFGGGGIWADGGRATVINSTINDNRGCVGGGIATFDAQLTVMNSIVSGNIAEGCPDIGGEGGGISFGVGTLTVANSIISGNFAFSEGGGITLLGGGTATITASSVTGNQAQEGGGGISNTDGATLTVSSSTINGNFVNAFGGGIYTYNAELTVMNSTINGNWTFRFNGNGGGIFYSGGGTLTVTDSTISGNSAVVGGGMGSDLPGGTTATVRNSTISGNFANTNVNSIGGGILNKGQTLTVTNIPSAKMSELPTAVASLTLETLL